MSAAQSTGDAPTEPDSVRPSLPTKLAYGFGSVAFGVKDGGFNYFLLLFYGTVVGLEPGLVGLAILIALVLDAISDPLVGYWSDNFRSRWGRRHPFMYAAAIPVAASYYLLWNPPDWSQGQLFAYLLSLSVLIRTFLTFYETPSSALLPELTPDYEERTKLQAYRLFFGWSGGNAMSVLMFGVLLVETSEYTTGTLNRDGYATYGVIASLLMFAAILISSIGTHSQIPTLRQPPPKEVFSTKKLFGEMLDTLREKSFLALFWATLLGSVATGFSASLAFIMLTYFWGFSSEQQFIWTALVFFSALLGFLIAPLAVKRLGKKRAVVVLGLTAFTVAPMPVILRLFGLMPENGDPILFPLVATINTLDLSLIIALQAVLYSMIADLVESSEVRTGRRSEGVFYAAVTFTRKCTVGLGSFAGGIILSVVAFPQGADRTQVSSETLWMLGALYAPTLLALWMAMIFAISRYKITKEEHAENLRKLAEAPGSPS
ncbi:MFS transporter [Parerythrobacter jejuensis]|uniref:MFS transporter n=1 Tax=Parerythrobacter jejuensis TaxID=795812 RepID=A0A845ARS3_9SPHN|nr:MFS transporter [Parerythrobacter jejuensis]MXP32189.1 MFS transporter [Parerythrobacter jejuensis]